MKPDPVHIRRVHGVENGQEVTLEQLFVAGELAYETREGLLPETVARKVADTYGVHISMDVLGRDEPEADLAALPTVVTEDHLDANAVSFNPVGLPSERQVAHAHAAFAQAVAYKLREAAALLHLPLENLSDAVGVLDSPKSPGLHRLYAVQRRINPAHARFLAEVTFIPGTANFSFYLGDVEVIDGLFSERS